jgi:Tol biopolymer transport system component
VWAQSVEAASAPELLADLPSLSPLAVISPDHHWLLLQSLVENTWDVLKVSLDSAPKLLAFSASRAEDVTPRFSPDGHWAAVVSNESGAFEVYLRSFPEPTVKTQVSVGGASGPVWSADGRVLYYVSGTAIMEARLATGPVVRVASRDTAFTQIRRGGVGYSQANFDVSRDGSRIVIPVSQSETYQLIVVPNWLTEFRQRMAAASKR